MFKDYPDVNHMFLKQLFIKDIESSKLARVIKDQLELFSVQNILIEKSE